jgi:hypothetical protein
MYSRARDYRRRGIEAQQRAESAKEQSLREAFGQVAVDWFALAEQVEWLDQQYDLAQYGDKKRDEHGAE